MLIRRVQSRLDSRMGWGRGKFPGSTVFARTGTAYDPNTGVAVTSGPRFQVAGGWQGIVMEETTANLLTANQSDIETDTTGFTAAGSTLSRDTTTSWRGAASLKVVTGGAGAGEGANLASAFAATSGTAYTFSCYLKGSGTVRLSFTGAVATTNGPTITLNSTWTRYQFTVTATSTAAMSLLVTTDVTQAITFNVDGLQAEAKAYATSWTLGGTTRNGEFLSVPSAGIINPSAGTIIVRLRLNRSAGTNLQYVASIGGSGVNGAVLYVNTDGTAAFRAGNGTSLLGGFSAATVPANTNVVLGGRWDSSYISTSVNGAINTTSFGPANTAITPLTNIAFGSDGAIRQLDGLIESIHIFDSALPDYVFAAYTSGMPIPLTRRHTYYNMFNGNMISEQRGIGPNGMQVLGFMAPRARRDWRIGARP